MVVECSGTRWDLQNLVCLIVQRAAADIEVTALQAQRLRKPQPGGRDQAEERLIGERAQRSCRRQPARRGQQVRDLRDGVDVRRGSSSLVVEDVGAGDFRAGFDLRTIPGERAEDLQTPRPGGRGSTLCLALCPVHHELDSEWATVPSPIGKSGKAQQQRTRGGERESEAPSLVQIALGQRQHGRCRGHSVLPGQGSAIAASRTSSTLA